jgi:hypothetical protein
MLVLAGYLLAGGSRSYLSFTIAGRGALDWGATVAWCAAILLAGAVATLLSGIKRLSFLQRMSTTTTILALVVYWIIATKEGLYRPSIFAIEPGRAILASVGILLAGAAVCLLLGSGGNTSHFPKSRQ